MQMSRHPRSVVRAHPGSDPSTYTDADWRGVIDHARKNLKNKNVQLDYGRVFNVHTKKQKWNHKTALLGRLSYSTYLVQSILNPFQLDTTDSRLHMYQNLVRNIDQGEEFSDECDPAISSISKCRDWLNSIHVNMYDLISMISALQAHEKNSAQEIIPPQKFEKKHQLHTFSDQNNKIFPKQAVKGTHKNACKTLLRDFHRYHY